MKPLQSFISIKPYLSFLDKGLLMPFVWIYLLIAILNLLLPFIILGKYLFFEYDGIVDIFSVGLISIILVYAGWVNFKLWVERANEMRKTYDVNNDFIITPLVSNFVKTSGESSGTWSLLFGTIGILSYILVPDYLDSLFSSLFIPVILFVSSFFIIIFSRFIAEQINVFSAIANNTKRQ